MKCDENNMYIDDLFR